MSAFHTTILQLGEFEVTSIPEGFDIYGVEVAEYKSHKRGKTFVAADEQKRRMNGETRTNGQMAIDRACTHVIHDLGWSRAVITIWLTRIADGEEGSMVYVCDHDEWETNLPDDDEAVFPNAARLPVAYGPDDTPTRAIGLLEAEFVEEAMQVEMV